MKKSQRDKVMACLGASATVLGAVFLGARGAFALQEIPPEDVTPQSDRSQNAGARADEAQVLAADVEEMGPMASQATVKLGPVTRLPDGSFLQILFAFSGVKTQAAKTPFEIVAVNLRTGKMTRTPSSPPSSDLANDVWTWAWGRDGKLYLGTAGTPHLIRYDPVTSQAKDYGRLWKDNKRTKVLYSLEVGTDGALYGGGVNDTNVMRFDPKTERLDEYGPQGLPRTSYPAYAYSVGGDERYIYTASGKQPWYIVALDRQTGKQRNLMTLPNTAFPSIEQTRANVYLKVSQGGKSTVYRLTKGEALPIDVVPPEINRWDPVPKNERPKVALDARTFGFQEKARLLYEERGANKEVVFDANTQPYKIQRLTTLPDGRIFGATFPYGDHFFFDPKTGKSSVAGPTNVSVYSQLAVGNLVYISGYPSTPLLVFDPSKPWNFQRQTSLDSLPSDDAVTTNPRRVAYFNQENIGTHYGYHLAVGADGKIYVGAHAERSRDGGGLGIYDPKSGAVSGIGEETFANHDVAGLAAVSNGRFIVYSSQWVKNTSRPDTKPEGAKIFVYDTTTQRLANTFAPVEKAATTGPIVAAGDSIVGVATAQKKQQFLYRINAASGEVAYSYDVQDELVGPFKMGPDGFLWTAEKTAKSIRLVKIAPKTGVSIPVATLPFTPNEFTFVGRDLYLANSDQLYRVRNVAGAAKP